MQATNKTFSFAELVKTGRDSSVRLTDDLFLFTIDLVFVVSGSKTRNDAGTVLRRVLSDELFSNHKLSYRSFPGSGNDKTCIISFENAIELIMVLGGKGAKKARCKFAKIIQRYLAGDNSLISEIEANAASDSPIAELARASLAAAAPAEAELSLTRKRKLEDLEIAKIELDIQERTENVKGKVLANSVVEQNMRVVEQTIRAAELDNLNAMTTSYGALCRDTVMDERARMMFKDNCLNLGMMKTAGLMMITNGPPNTPISISMVAVGLGLKLSQGELISAGSAISKRYKTLHGEPPSKHDQICEGRMTAVNTYMESDRGLLEEVLRERHAAAALPQRGGMLQHFPPAAARV